MNLLKTLSTLCILFIYFFLISCGSDDPSPAKSRDIRFEVTGNFSGTMSATFITASGGATNESILSLPWNKDITYVSSVASTSMAVAATGGVAGQTIRIKVFAGGSLVSDTPGVANSSGMVGVSSPAYVF